MIKTKLKLNALARSWQLGLLALTSVVLSAASGWTTWDGMQNFTGEAVLSLMITFGIQGVMLILAWLVGARLSEFRSYSGGFAAGTSDLSPRLKVIVSILQTAIVLSLCLLLASIYFTYNFDITRYVNGSLATLLEPKFILTILFCATLILLILKYRDTIADSILQSATFLMRNSVPIAMLLACGFASVFFSFDSLFSTILPKQERERMANLRSSSETSQILDDIVDASEVQKAAAVRSLLATPQWSAFTLQVAQLDGQLQKLPAQAQKAWDEARERSILKSAQNVEHNEKLRLDLERSERQKNRLTVSLRESRQRLAHSNQEIVNADVEIDKLEKQIVSKTVELDGEERGLGVTGRSGRGPQYQRIAGELKRLEARRDNLMLKRQRFAEQRTNLQGRLKAVEVEFASASATVKQLTNRLAQVSQGRSAVVQVSSPRDIAAAAKQASLKLDQSLRKFESNPTEEHLNALQTTCAQTQDFLRQSQTISLPASQPHCNIGAVNQAAVQVFALHRNAAKLQQSCMAKNTEIDALPLADRIAFARDCLSWSGLKATESRDIAHRIDRLERERDDKAHRFVVTTNAFLDGNKLAFLALAIALTIDALVLASGFLGATATRSPLAGADLAPGHSAAQREAIIKAALLPDIAANARTALETLLPADHHVQTDRGNQPDAVDRRWTHQLELNVASQDTQAAMLRKLANAATAVGAARCSHSSSTAILIKPQLVDYLCILSEASVQTDGRDEALRTAMSAALGPDIARQAQGVVGYLVPSMREQGFSSEIDIASVEPQHEAIVRLCLNVASAFNLLKQADGMDGQIVLAKSELYFALIYLAKPAALDDGIAHPGDGGMQTHTPHNHSEVSHSPLSSSVGFNGGVANKTAAELLGARASHQALKIAKNDSLQPSSQAVASEENGVPTIDVDHPRILIANDTSPGPAKTAR